VIQWGVTLQALAEAEREVMLPLVSTLAQEPGGTVSCGSMVYAMELEEEEALQATVECHWLVLAALVAAETAVRICTVLAALAALVLQQRAPVAAVAPERVTQAQ